MMDETEKYVRSLLDGVDRPTPEERAAAYERARQGTHANSRKGNLTDRDRAGELSGLEETIAQIEWQFSWEDFIVKRYLGDGHKDLTISERRAAYARTYGDLNKYRDGGANKRRLSESEYKRTTRIVDRAIAALETQYRKNASWGDRLYDRVTSAWSSVDTKYKGLIAALQFVADFLKPLLELTSAMAVLSGIGALALFAMGRIAPEARPKLHPGCTFLFGLCLCSTGLLTAQKYVPRAEAKGVIGASIPVASHVQDALVASLARIEANTKELTAGVGRIEETAKELKKETSIDPQKELANLGFNDRAAAFSTAIRDADVRLLNVTLDTGFKIRRDGFQPYPYLSLFKWTPYLNSNQQMKVAIRRMKDEIQQDLCQNITINKIEVFRDALLNLGSDEYAYYCGAQMPPIKEMSKTLVDEWIRICNNRNKVAESTASLYKTAPEKFTCTAAQYKKLLRDSAFSINDIWYVSKEEALAQIEAVLLKRSPR